VLDRQLRTLIDDHAEAVYRVAYGVLRDRGLAEDVVQETMVKAWEALDDFRGDASLRTWILRIAHNTSVSALRRRRDLATAPEDLPDVATGDETARRAAGREGVVALGRALDGLDELSRSVVVLREVEGLSYAQIADALDVPLATVKTRLLRARRVLQAAVEGDGAPHPPEPRRSRRPQPHHQEEPPHGP
jgi:RNA polymerase sigma-70 factor (ECF subfamily)